MKKLLLILLLFAGLKVWSQDLEVYKMPEYTAVANDSTDVMYIDDSGVDKHIEMPTLLGAIHDSVTSLSSMLDSALYNSDYTSLEALIGGGTVGWSRGAITSRVYVTTTTDSVGIGLSVPTAKLDVSGNARFRNNVYLGTAGYGFSLSGTTITANTKLSVSDDLNITSMDKLIFGYGADQSVYMIRSGDNMTFTDPIAGTKTLLELSTGSGSGTGVVDTAGGQAANQFAYWTDNHTLDGSSSFTVSSDSIVATNVVINTKLRLKAFDNDAVDTVGLILYKATGKVDTATIIDAGFGLKKTPLFMKYFTNRVNGELNWPRYEGDSYHDKNAETGQLQAGLERAYVWIFRMQIWMFAMFLVIVWLTVKVIKK